MHGCGSISKTTGKSLSSLALSNTFVSSCNFSVLLSQICIDRRWEVGEIASRIGQLYYNYYLHTSQLTFLLEAYIFYEAIAAREYFKENIRTDPALANKQLRYVTRFIVVSLLLNRRDMARKLLRQLRSLVEEYSSTFQVCLHSKMRMQRKMTE